MSGASLPVMRLAASHPQRVALTRPLEPFRAVCPRPPDHPFGIPESFAHEIPRRLRGRHRNGCDGRRFWRPAGHATPAKRRWWGAQRAGLPAAPDISQRFSICFLRTDARPLLESIQAPTLVDTTARWTATSVTTMCGNLAERIPHARLLEFDGDDSVWFRRRCRSRPRRNRVVF